jgi:hypothetical protein
MHDARDKSKKVVTQVWHLYSFFFSFFFLSSVSGTADLTATAVSD